MSDVRSKNLYEALGNDPELDSDREPEPPVNAVDKAPTRRGKRDAPVEPRASNVANARGGPRGPRPTGNEQAFRDRNAGSANNRSKPTDEVPQDRLPPAAHRNRDTRGNMIRDDRRSRTDRVVSGKQVDQGWGAKSGDQAWKDEKVGEAIARTEGKEGAEGTAEEAAEEEPEDKSRSYTEYLAELAESKREDLGVQEARKPNEGAKVDKKWAAAKELKRAEEEDEYIKGQEKEKARREKQRKEKNLLEVDMRFVEPPRRGGDSFRGRGRGGGERGGDRGGRGAGRGRGGETRGRGEFRGRGNGAPRGGAHHNGPTVDEKNFPSLGGK